MEIEIKLLKDFYDFLKKKSLFLLGAGASNSYVKAEYGLYEKAKRLIPYIIGDYDSFQDDIELRKEESERIKIQGGKHTLHKMHDGRILIDDTEFDFYDEIIYKHPEILEYVCALEYSLDAYPDYCPEYQIFSFANKQSIVLNMNHDNLAERFIPSLKVISLHGSISPEIKRVMREYIPHMLDLDVKEIFLKKLFLATQENERHLLGTEQYKHLLNELSLGNFEYIVIVGYSFFKKSDCAIYDTVTYDLIRLSLMDDPVKIIIINPGDDEFLADIIANDNTSPYISCYPIYWNRFTYSFYTMHSLKYKKSSGLSSTDLRRFKFIYKNCEYVEPERLKFNQHNDILANLSNRKSCAL